MVLKNELCKDENSYETTPCNRPRSLRDPVQLHQYQLHASILHLFHLEWSVDLLFVMVNSEWSWNGRIDAISCLVIVHTSSDSTIFTHETNKSFETVVSLYTLHMVSNIFDQINPIKGFLKWRNQTLISLRLPSKWYEIVLYIFI